MEIIISLKSLARFIISSIITRDIGLLKGVARLFFTLVSSMGLSNSVNEGVSVGGTQDLGFMALDFGILKLIEEN